MFLPYANEQKETMADVLIREFTSNQWREFRSAVAFARQTGNSDQLVAALTSFADKGNRVEMTFGANTFAEGEGSDYEAIETLLANLADRPNVRLFLYNQPGRTFHPKLYLFSNDKQALLIVGSSNWSDGGLVRNIEVNVLIYLTLDDPEEAAVFKQTLQIFETYWKEIE